MKAERSFVNRLPMTVRSQMLAMATACTMVPGELLARAGAPTRFVYFPESGVVSLSARLGRSHGGLIMLVGRESLIGAHILLGQTRSPLDATVIIAGDAHRLTAAGYLRLMASESALDRCNRQALAVLLRRACLANLCVQHHRLAARLAGLLAELTLRNRSDTIPVTHETLAALLGVRREGISLQAADFRRRGLISYTRGVVTISNAAGLHSLACECNPGGPG
jgi:CRP-like cAMP-binding protein